MPAIGKPSASASAAVSSLYDLSKDLGETTDVAKDHPDIVSRLSEIHGSSADRIARLAAATREADISGLGENVGMTRNRARNAYDSRRRERIEAFVRDLGWKKPQPFEKTIVLDERQVVPWHIVWYESGDSGNNRTDCFLQVNDLGCDRSTAYCAAAVYAPRFRICTGFWPVRLILGEASDAQALRLAERFHRNNFVSLIARRNFRAARPEADGYSWQAIPMDGPPYVVHFTSRNKTPRLIQRKSVRCKEVLAKL